MISTPKAPEKATGNSPAEQAKADGMINETSLMALNNLFNMLNYQNFGAELQFRVAAAAMICNKIGIMAGRGGGNDKSKGGMLEKTSYRQSLASSGFPTASLPTSLEALRSQSEMDRAAPKYGDSELFSAGKSTRYKSYPVHADYESYRDFKGPPLAPDNENSRVITNYNVSVSGGGAEFQATCGWDDIYNIDDKGQKHEFLEELFDGRPGVGKGKGMPARDLRGATDYENDQFRRQIDAWLDKLSTGKVNIV